jgi:hypothetical protein
MPDTNQPKRKRLAIVTTIWRYLSHAQHMGDRFLVGYPWNGRWHTPEMDVVALYVDQKPEGDQSQERAKEFGFTVYPTIAETVRCGTDRLAVDGVLIIGEHGDYPINAKGQVQYPRYEFFEQVAKVFEQDGRSVPVFNDKHLSYSFEKAAKMVATSKRLGFPMLAGSSLPVTWRLPNVELPLDCSIDEALMVGVGGSDPMDYHALEAMQCMLERRRNGETGVKAVQLIEGPAVWQAGRDGRWSRRLLEAALARSNSRSGKSLEDGRPQDLTHSGELEELVKDPAAYFIEYKDGLRATLLMINGAVSDYTFACRVRGMPEIVSTQFLLPPNPNVAYSTCLMNKVEEMIATGVAPYPVERTQLVSSILDMCLESKVRNHQRLDTPQLNVQYRAPRTSQFCGAPA